MNYLAHTYLSGDDHHIIIGNFIADGVKGKKYLEYPEQITKGIIYHRAIDSFTDQHETVKQSIRRLQQTQGKYSGVAIDMFYDHFLAKYWTEFSEIPLSTFIQTFYKTIEINQNHLPEKVKMMFGYMQQHDWLKSYETIDGIDSALKGLSRRTKFPSNLHNAALDLEKDFNKYKDEFFSFFPELVSYCHSYLV